MIPCEVMCVIVPLSFDEFECVCEEVWVLLPCAFAGDAVDEGGEGFAGGAEGDVFRHVAPLVVVELVPRVREISLHDALPDAVFVGDVLQAFDGDICDLDAVGHEGGADEQLVVPSGRFRHDCGIQRLEVGVMKHLLVWLCDGEDLADVVAREDVVCELSAVVHGDVLPAAVHAPLRERVPAGVVVEAVFDDAPRHCLAAFEYGLGEAVAVVEIDFVHFYLIVNCQLSIVELFCPCVRASSSKTAKCRTYSNSSRFKPASLNMCCSSCSCVLWSQNMLM